jgi:4'-phosphopantetheinyl transferase EntD
MGDWIRNLMPPETVCVEGPILTAGWETTAGENALTEIHLEKRRAEFLTGRTYARRALGLLGHEAPSLLANPDRSPVWPEGIAGCITHTRDYCAVAAAKSPAFRSLGIDIEIPGRLTEEIGRKVFTEAELIALAAGPETSRRERKSAVFCAKEAFYKMQFPLNKAWVGFQDVNVVLAGDDGFSLTLLKGLGGEFTAGRVFQGRYILAAERVGAFMCIR